MGATSSKSKEGISAFLKSGSVRAILRSLVRSFLFRLFLAICLLYIVGSVAIYYLERDASGTISSLGEAFWWLLVTITTVGYGDFTPITLGGRVIASVLIVSGVALIPITVARLSSHTVARRLKEERGLEKIKTRNHVVVCGWHEGIDAIVDGLAASQRYGEIVLVNSLAVEDINEMLLRYKSIGLRFVHGDFTSEAILDLANMRHAASAIILTDMAQGDISKSDERVVLATLAVKTMNPKVRVCAEVTQGSAASHVRRAGADEVIVHGEHDPFLIASAATAEGVVLAARQLLSHDEDNCLQQRDIPAEFVGRDFADLSAYFRQKQNAILLGVISMGKSLDVADVLSGDYALIDEFIERKFKEAGKEYLTSQFEVPRATLNPGDDYIIRKGEVAIVIAR